MLIPLVTAAALLAGAQAQAFQPPDCVRAVPAHTENGRMVVQVKSPHGLSLASPRGKVGRRLTRGSDWWAKFSPDGRKLVFTRNRRDHRAAIVTLNIASGRTRQLFVAKAGETAEEPVWSADGKSIAFMHSTGQDEDYRIDVEMMRSDGSERHAVHKVSHLAYPVPTLAWSRNGRCIAYEWGNFSQGAVAVASPDFTEPYNLVPFPTVMPDGLKTFVPFGAAFGADGKRLYVTLIASNEDEADRIYALRLDRQGIPTPVVDGWMPLESPDGRSFTWYDADDHVTRIRPVSSKGGGRRLMKPMVFDWAPAQEH